MRHLSAENIFLKPQRRLGNNQKVEVDSNCVVKEYNGSLGLDNKPANLNLKV